MFRNYLKIAFRTLTKYKFYSFLNIGGLSVGICFVLLTFGFIWRELHVNANIRNIENQYIITSEWKQANMGNSFTSFGQLSKFLKEQYPNLVENYYRFDGITTNVARGNKVFREDLQIGDSSLLSMFGFELLEGNKKTAFEEPFSIVVTPEVAKKYFGKTNVVGQTLDIQNFSGQKHPFKITGVIDIPNENSVTNLLSKNPCGVYASILDIEFFNRNMNWQNNSIPNYIELRKGVKASALILPMKKLIARNTNAEVSNNIVPNIEPLSTYYLTTNNGVNQRMLFTIATIALFILLMAIVNFTNLSISRSSARMKEIGLRKVLGSQRKQLIFQFLAESYALVFISTIIGLVLYILTFGFFGKIIGKEIPALWDYPLYTFLYLLIFIVFIGLLAGLYPAFVLSSFRPMEALRSKGFKVKESKYLRSGLVVVQFVVTIVVLVNVWVVGKQVSFLLNSNIGFEKDYLITAQLPRDWTKNGVQKMHSFQRQFSKLPSVKDVALSFEIPNGNAGGSVPVYSLGADSSNSITMSNIVADAHYLSTYQVPLSAGRFFNENKNDSGNIVLNQTAIQALGWKDANASIGKKIRIPNDPTIFTIIGVTKDFNFGSLQSKIPPILFFNVDNVTAYRYFSLKINGGNPSAAVSAIENKWHELMPDAAFEYQFMDDVLKQLYQKEQQFRNAAYLALGLSLLMVTMGIVGLISLSIQKRVKEVAVRKVLGASVKDIIVMFVTEYFWILLIGNVIALPIAFYIGKKWLNNYAYHIALSYLPFLFAGISIVLFTIAIITLQTSKAATVNPAKSLKTE